MVKIVCPCCLGSGKVNDEPPVSLTPLQGKIYDIVLKAKNGITGNDLVTRLYADREDGGPDWASVSMHVMIHRMNIRLAPFKQRIKGTRPGLGAVIRLERL